MSEPATQLLQTIALLGLGLPVGGLLVLTARALASRAEPPSGAVGEKAPLAGLIPLVGPLILLGSGASSDTWRRAAASQAVCATVGAWAGWGQGDLALAVTTACLGWHLALVALIDARHYWLPDALTLPLLAAGLGASLLLDRTPWPLAIAGVVLGGLGLWGIGFVYRRVRGRQGLGGGDPILLAAIGAWVGATGLPSVLLWASAAGLSVVLAKLATGERPAGDDRLPFGVYLAIGGWMTWLYGPIGLGAAF